MSVIFFLFSYKENKKVWDKLNGVILSVSIVSGLAFFPGMIFTGIHFKKAKSTYLIKKGILNKALVTRKIGHRSIRAKEFEVYFSFNTNSSKTISSFDIVSEDEFSRVNGGDSVLIIYSTEKPEIVDLIIDKDAFETYKSRIGNINNYQPQNLLL
jgi:hypothetical protein